jgi:hypothetical protein
MDFGVSMEPLARPASHRHTRRSFFVSLACAGLAAKALAWNRESDSENVRRFVTPECEVRMSVEYFANSATNSLRFRDSLTNRAFCLSPNGEDNSGCQAQFSGSLAIAHYHFRSRAHVQIPLNLRERVLTIDHDGRMDPRPPFERLLAIQRGTVSDIQAFGYNPNAPDQRGLGQPGSQSGSSAPPPALWCLLRQDLFLNQQPVPFLIVHWKHTFGAITLLDVIPGDRTELRNA